MKRIALIAALLSFPAFAQDAKKEPTVTLTAAELQALIAAEVATAQAGAVIQKVREALSPKGDASKKENVVGN